MTTTRLLCIANTPNPVQVPPGIPANAPGNRFYSATQGQIIDALGDDTGDAAVLRNSGYFASLAQSGTTSERPTYPRIGQQYVDTTLSKLVTFDGAAWRDVAGSAV